MILVIGSKRYSSWSLRPWLVLKHFGLPFEEKRILLDRPETAAQIARISPSGKVPALRDGDLTVCESLAICEYLNDKFPDCRMWPADLKRRAQARSWSHEMHAGFQALREHLPFDADQKRPGFDFSPAAKDIARIREIWTQALQSSGGPYLFGDFCIADAMFAPVASRFATYEVPMSGPVRDYAQTLLRHPALSEWIEDARQEPL